LGGLAVLATPEDASRALAVLRALETQWLERISTPVEREKFFPKGSQHDAYVEIRSIVKQAQVSVTIIDPYMDSSMFIMLGTLGPQKITVQLLAQSRNIPRDFAYEAKKFVLQHTWAALEIRMQADFHDRFVILDDKRCFHIGASIKDAGNKAFMISEVEDPKNISDLVSNSMTSWTKAVPVAY
jgi:hypothetical protein